MNKRELFELCGRFDTPDSVVCVSGAAGDNAADTIGWDNRFNAYHVHSDEFIEHWYGSVQCMLCVSDADPEAIQWFESHGVKY